MITKCAISTDELLRTHTGATVPARRWGMWDTPSEKLGVARGWQWWALGTRWPQVKTSLVFVTHRLSFTNTRPHSGWCRSREGRETMTSSLLLYSCEQMRDLHWSTHQAGCIAVKGQITSEMSKGEQTQSDVRLEEEWALLQMFWTIYLTHNNFAFCAKAAPDFRVAHVFITDLAQDPESMVNLFPVLQSPVELRCLSGLFWQVSYSTVFWEVLQAKL